MPAPEQQRRYQALARALSQLQLRDDFGLRELLTAQDLPTEADIERALNSNDAALPSHLPASFVAESLATTLRDWGADTSKGSLSSQEIEELLGIAVGPGGAGTYHKFMFRVLPIIFEGSLANAIKEQSESGGIKYIDIVFDNVAVSGFFRELIDQHAVTAPHVVVECKNYSDDVGSKEYDQISGRLGRNVGIFGLLVCRSISDKDRALKYQLDALKRRDHRILILDDEDAIALIQAAIRADDATRDQLLRSKMRQLNFA